MVAPGSARELLCMLRGPHARRHPFDLYWIWVFSTEKRWWMEARRRFLFSEGAEQMDQVLTLRK